jgi:hypothetical protein
VLDQIRLNEVEIVRGGLREYVAAAHARPERSNWSSSASMRSKTSSPS